MITRIDDDYLICKHYYNHIDDVSSEYEDFITYVHNKNHYFAWINDGKVIMRSEAYPSEEKMIRGIKAIIKNRDIVGRYSIQTKHGANFLLLWGGGDREKHTGNFDKHNEIGRSCPTKTKEELHSLMMFRGKDFADKVMGIGSKNVGAGAALAATGTAAYAAKSNKKTSSASKVAASTAATTTESVSTGGGFKWWYLLPLLLIPLFFLWKGCGTDTASVKNTVVKSVEKKVTDTKAAIAPAVVKVDEAKAAAEVKAAKVKSDAEASARVKAAKAERERKAKAAKAAQMKSRMGNKTSGF